MKSSKDPQWQLADIARFFSYSRQEWVSRYTLGVIVLGAGITLLALSHVPEDRLGLLIFAVLAGITELSNVELFASSRSRVSVSSIIAVASIPLFGPWAGALVHLCSGLMTFITTSLRGNLAQSKRASLLRRSAFNAGMWVTAASLAGWAYKSAGGTFDSMGHLHNVLPLLLASTTDVLINIMLLIGVIALQTGQRPRHIWNQNFSWAAPIAVAGGVVGGGALAMAYQMFHLTGVIVFMLPIFATAYSFRLYINNSRGYVEQLEEALVHLRKSEERYALASRGANDGLWDWDLITNEVFFSWRWKAMLGYQEHEISNQPDEWLQRVHPGDLPHLRSSLDTHLAGASAHFEDEYRIQHKDGTYRWMLTRGLAVRDENGPYRMAGSQTDITERKQAEEQLLHDAFHDDLTQLPNRALFIDRLEHAINRARQYPDIQFAVLFLDLDRFKVVNDRLGHMIGDKLLIALAGRVQTMLRPSDTIARLGGDELLSSSRISRDYMKLLHFLNNFRHCSTTHLS